MITEFASPERETKEKIQEQNSILKNNSLVKTLLNSTSDIIIVINKERQIVLANDKCLNLLNIKDEETIIGKRFGEAIECVHSDETEGGCGTTQYCKYCGAVNGILKCQKTEQNIIEECRIIAKKDEVIEALNLRVWTTPFEFSGEKFIIFAAKDISDEKHRQFLERIFFHDIMNLAGGLQGIMELMPELDPDSAKEFQSDGLKVTQQLIGEIESQKSLLAAERGELQVEFRETDASTLLSYICNLYRNHEVADKKFIAQPEITGDTIINTDSVLLTRVIGNLIKNALEASNKGQTVKVSYKKEKGEIIFSVHNETVIPEEVKLQMFNKSFSTKASSGRGLGTYSIKLLTEKYLKGMVEFTSEEGKGTTFFIKFREE